MTFKPLMALNILLYIIYKVLIILQLSYPQWNAWNLWLETTDYNKTEVTNLNQSRRYEYRKYKDIWGTYGSQWSKAIMYFILLPPDPDHCFT